ncbi:MAG: hypothetical protein BWY19_01043 [bacterium ADurb.Bin212]|nr:MAG: hypothetical protein BWY19_01043 [bacterium ADurb.Bin212]
MTTPNHSIVAGMVVVAVSGEGALSHIVAGAALLAGHFVFDLIPHKHWWDNYKDHNPLSGRNLFMVAVEVTVGLFLVPMFLAWLFDASLALIPGLSLVANLPDFLAPVVPFVKRLNDCAHEWESELPQIMAWRAEIGQTILLIVLVYTLWAS